MRNADAEMQLTIVEVSGLNPAEYRRLLTINRLALRVGSEVVVCGRGRKDGRQQASEEAVRAACWQSQATSAVTTAVVVTDSPVDAKRHYIKLRSETGAMGTFFNIKNDIGHDSSDSVTARVKMAVHVVMLQRDSHGNHDGQQ